MVFFLVKGEVGHRRIKRYYKLIFSPCSPRQRKRKRNLKEQRKEAGKYSLRRARPILLVNLALPFLSFLPSFLLPREPPYIGLCLADGSWFFCFESVIYNPLHAAQRAMAAAGFSRFNLFLPRTSLRGYSEVSQISCFP